MSKKFRLVADFGGTHARVGLSKSGKLYFPEKKRYQNNENVKKILCEYLLDKNVKLDSIRISAAGPIKNDRVELTNSQLVISSKELYKLFSINDIKIFNDAEAASHAIPYLEDKSLFILSKKENKHNTFGFITLGTGLGVSGIKCLGNNNIVISGEGGYSHLPTIKNDKLFSDAIMLINKSFTRISCERVISGPGLELLFSALIKTHGLNQKNSNAEEIINMALNDFKSLEFKTCIMILNLLGSFAATVTLIYGARGGMFLSGGLLQRMIPLVQYSNLTDNFYIEGRMKGYISAIPLYIINDDLISLKGCAFSP